VKKLVVLLILISTTSVSHSQVSKTEFWNSEEPIFKSLDDSVKYTSAQEGFQGIMGSQANQAVVDSLMKVIFDIRKNGIVGFRKVYKGCTDFVVYDSKANLSDVKRLTISLPIKKIPKEVLQGKDLETLQLVNTRIRKIPKLKGLSHLTTIQVLSNKPTRKLKLGKNESVKTLVIKGANPELIPSSFKKLKNLEKLDLAATDLAAFPAGASKNKKLKELLLSGNQITLKNDRIPIHSLLEKLELQKNKINALPATIKSFPSLTRLTLNFNQIVKVDRAIALLTKHEQLSFYTNKLKEIPAGVYSLQNLKEIDLYYNQIERIDDRIADLQNLEVLYLSNNLMAAIPESLSSLPNLQELYLSNNRLSELPLGIASMGKLKVLRINNNRLIRFPIDLLRLTKTENIDISSNQISDLPNGLSQLPSLKLLILAITRGMIKLAKTCKPLQKSCVVARWLYTWKWTSG